MLSITFCLSLHFSKYFKHVAGEKIHICYCFIEKKQTIELGRSDNKSKHLLYFCLMPSELLNPIFVVIWKFLL